MFNPICLYIVTMSYALCLWFNIALSIANINIILEIKRFLLAKL